MLVRPPPICQGGQVEALSSWLHRLALANGFLGYGDLLRNERLTALTANMVDTASGDSALITTLTRLSMQPSSRLHAHSLDEHLSALRGDPMALNRRWLLSSSGRAGRNGARFSICPACLSSDERPFWRANWRLSTTTTCAIHRCLLIDACPSCGAPPAMSASRFSPLDRCASCDTVLASITSNTRAEKAPIWRSEPGLTAQTALPVSLSFPHLWWDGVRILLHLLTKQRVLYRLAEAVTQSRQRGPFKASDICTHLSFDALPVGHRHRLLEQVDWLTSAWPHRFIEFVSAARLTWCDLSTSELEMPYWLLKVCREQFDRKQYRFSEQEAIAATALLAQAGAATSKVAVKRLLGAAECKALNRIRPLVRRSLTPNELSAVVHLLDADIASAPSGRDFQAAMLRDACCIAVAIWQQISFRAVCRLELGEGLVLLYEWRDAALVPSARGQLASVFYRWMGLYLHGTRLRFLRYDAPVTALFLSRFGVALEGFGLAARFSEVLRRSGIHDGQLGARLLQRSSL